jgi:hypothetical protein
MHFFGGKKGTLRPKCGIIFKLIAQLAAFYPGSTSIRPGEKQTRKAEAKRGGQFTDSYKT